MQKRKWWKIVAHCSRMKTEKNSLAGEEWQKVTITLQEKDSPKRLTGDRKQNKAKPCVRQIV